MGYSCTVRAHDVLRRTLNSKNGEDVRQYHFSNTWENDGKKYFFERGRENNDGSITGTVFMFVGETQCRKYGSLKIMPDGIVKSWPGMPKSYYLPQTILA